MFDCPLLVLRIPWWVCCVTMDQQTLAQSKNDISGFQQIPQLKPFLHVSPRLFAKTKWQRVPEQTSLQPSCLLPLPKLQGIIAGTLLYQLDAPQCHWRNGPPILGVFAPKVVHRPIVGGASPKRCYGPRNLNRSVQCFQCLIQGTKMPLLSKLLTSGVNLPSADVEAAPGGLAWRLPE